MVVAGSLLRLAENAPLVTSDTLTGPTGVLVLAPHPDDESLGCGGAVALAVQRQVPVRVVVMTDGSRSHPASRRFAADRLAALRREEVEAAWKVLTGSSAGVIWLGYPDCGLPADRAGLNRLVDALEHEVESLQASAVWAPWVNDPHCDHEATAEIARMIGCRRPGLARWSYPVWGRFGELAPSALPRRGRLVRLDTHSVEGCKTRAIAAHRSQMTALIDDDPDGFVMPPAMQRHFARHPEIFIRDA
jgi:LmbE family N-acetylglucosaminyl deacetylase